MDPSTTGVRKCGQKQIDAARKKQIRDMGQKFKPYQLERTDVYAYAQKKYT